MLQNIFNNNHLTWLNTAPDHPEDVVRLLSGIFGGDSNSNFPENSEGDSCKIFLSLNFSIGNGEKNESS